MMVGAVLAVASPGAPAQASALRPPESDRTGPGPLDRVELRWFDPLPTNAAVAPMGDPAPDERAEQAPVTHVVGPGESLADIADAHDLAAGDGWRRLFDANPHIDDPDVLRVGTEVEVPPPGAEPERRALPAADERGPAAGVWDRLARCESRGRWSASTGNGFHGGLQFHPRTWAAFGGHRFAPDADQATREQEIAVAERVLAAQGWGAWPACSTQLGLR